jgi:hypothetical protein
MPANDDVSSRPIRRALDEVVSLQHRPALQERKGTLIYGLDLLWRGIVPIW